MVVQSLLSPPSSASSSAAKAPLYMDTCMAFVVGQEMWAVGERAQRGGKRSCLWRPWRLTPQITCERFNRTRPSHHSKVTCTTAKQSTNMNASTRTMRYMYVRHSRCDVQTTTSSGLDMLRIPRPKPAATAPKPPSLTSPRNTSCASASRALFLRISRMTPCARAQFGHSSSCSPRQRWW